MKTNWSVPIAIASLVLALLTLVMNMNRVSGDDAREIDRRIGAIEGRLIPVEKAADRNDKRIDDAAATLADHNLRLDRLERTKR